MFLFWFFHEVYVLYDLTTSQLTEPNFCRKFIFSLIWVKRAPQGQIFFKNAAKEGLINFLLSGGDDTNLRRFFFWLANVISCNLNIIYIYPNMVINTGCEENKAPTKEFWKFVLSFYFWMGTSASQKCVKQWLFMLFLSYLITYIFYITWN